PMVLVLGLPDGDGLAVLRRIRQHEEPVLVPTARGSLRQAVRVRRAIGAAGSASETSSRTRSKRLTPGTLRSHFRPPPKLLRNGARAGSLARNSEGCCTLLIRRQTRLSRGVKDILVTGITVTMLVSSVATASAQNIFEALFGRLWTAPATSAEPPPQLSSPESTRSEGGVAY